jgi:very-short-patch-repair endonuclease
MSGRSHNRVQLKERRKKLRRNLTPAEAFLWSNLKDSRLAGRKFRRQHSVGPFILDFYCVEEWLGVELDGEVHRTERAIDHDYERKLFLNKAGIKVLRFENFLVFQELDYVLHRIESNFGSRTI